MNDIWGAWVRLKVKQLHEFKFYSFHSPSILHVDFSSCCKYHKGGPVYMVI